MPSPAVTATWGADDYSKFVLDHLSVESAILASGARRINITGKQAHVPRLNSSGTASWTAELQEIVSSAPDADEILLVPKKTANVLVVSTEAIEDAEVDVLNRVGDAMARSVAVALDTKAFSADAATALAPAGLRSYTLPGVTGDPTLIDTLLTGIGAIRNAGGNANSIYMAAADVTTLSLMKQATGSNVPLLAPDPTQSFSMQIGGARIWPVPGMPAGTALIAQADQIVVGVRRDIAVDFSADAKFTADGVAVRITARFDVDVNDTDGLYLIA